MIKDVYWQNFYKTGCISDYLEYTAHKRSNIEKNYECVVDSGEDFSNTYAGFGKCDGDDFEIGTYR